MSEPKILVLLASYNGARWIREQLESILAQQGVDVRVVIRDDGSSDGTLQEIARFAEDGRIILAPRSDPTGSAAQNFLSLLRDNSAEGFGFVAFADQDDVWHRDKLQRAHRIMSQSPCVGYSSATIAMWPDGHRAVLRQRGAVTRADFLFEGAGQGCTFVLSSDFYESIRQFVANHRELTRDLHYHDWMVYALARAGGESWTFDPVPSVIYRQHARNDTGARSTPAGLRKRLALIRRGWYRTQLAEILELCCAAAPENRVVFRWRSIFRHPDGWMRRLRIAAFCLRHGRRRPTDNLMIAFAALAGWI